VSEDRNHYIYRWVDPNTNLPFYIGQGKYHKNSKYKRANEKHVGNKKGEAYCQNKADKLFRSGTPHRGEIIFESLSGEEANEIEVFLINKYGRLDIRTGILTNLSRGGDFNPTKDPEIEARRLKTIKSDEYRKKMSEIVRNRYLDDEYRKKVVLGKSLVVDPTAKPIEFNGVEYSSVRKLSKHLGVAYETIRSRIKMGIPLGKKVTYGSR
jgi:hypothetical protein